MRRDPLTDRAVQVRKVVDYARSQAEQADAVKTVLPNPTSPAPGSIPGYVILDEVHRGGQGVVYRAKQASTRREVAIKILRNGTPASPLERTRFEREIRLLAQIKHPNIVSLHDGGVASGLCFLVMDFVEGEALDAYVERSGLSVKETLELAAKICDAVNAAHLRGVVHRDLKPSNIRVDARGEPRVLDFGLAKLVSGDDVDGLGPTKVTVTGQFVGSLPWAAPEQVDGHSERIDVRTDVYALGVILYRLTTGKFPYEVVGNMRAVMDGIVSSSPVRPSTHRVEVDHDLETIILKCLSKDRERRYESAGELARELRCYLGGEPIEAKRDSTFYVLSKMARRHRVITGLLVLMVAVVAAYAATVTMLYRRVALAEQARVASDETSRARLRQTYEAVKFIFDGTSALSRITGGGKVRREMLRGAFDRLAPVVVTSAGDLDIERDLARAHHLLCDIAEEVGDIPSAREHCEEALQASERFAAERPGDRDTLRTLAFSLVRVGDMSKAEGELDACRSFYDRAMRIQEQLIEADPSNSGFLDDLMWSHERLGDQERLRGKLDKAREHHEQQLRLAERLLSDEPGSPARMHANYSAHMQLGLIAQLSSNYVSWKTHVDEAAGLAEQCVLREPQNPQFIGAQLNAWVALGSVAWFEHDLVTARRFRELAHQRALDRYTLEPEVAVHQRTLADLTFDLGVVAQSERDIDGAEQCYRSVLKLNQEHGLTVEAVDARKRLAVLAEECGRTAEARALRLEAFDLAERNAMESDATAGTAVIFAGAARDLAQESTRYRQLAIDACHRAESGNEPLTPALWYCVGSIYRDLGDAANAERCLQESLNRLPPEDSSLRREIVTTLGAMSPHESGP